MTKNKEIKNNLVSLDAFRQKKQEQENQTIEQDNPLVLTDIEVEAIILSVIQHKDPEDFSEEELEKVLEWAQNTVLDSTIFKLAINGMISLSWDFENNDLIMRSIDDE